MKKYPEKDPAEFAKWFRELPEEEKRKGSLIQLKQAEEDWAVFGEGSGTLSILSTFTT